MYRYEYMPKDIHLSNIYLIFTINLLIAIIYIQIMKLNFC